MSLCEQSSYIADEIARYPVLLDELLEPTVHSSPLALEELDDELAARLEECEADDTEAQISVLGQFQRANQFRVAIADVAGHLPIMKVSDSLTFLAEAVLDYALESAWLDLTDKHGAPHYEIQVSSNLPGAWTAIDTVATNTWTVPAGGRTRYYRIRPTWH